MKGEFVVIFPIEGLISPPRMRRMAMDQIGPMLEKQQITLTEGRWSWHVEFHGRDRYLVARHGASTTAPPDLVEQRAHALAEGVRGPLPSIAQRIEASIAAYDPGDLAEEPAPSPRVCSVDGCEGKVVARGWCNRHYYRARAHGDPTRGRIPYSETPARLDALEALLAQGVDRDRAVQRCGWKSWKTAVRTADRTGRAALAGELRRAEPAGVAS
ncbi:hypothetical protein [Brachybacterium phenoliresistens]|uniref:hypothetical protein n=1 Tax=Brachybacterium phenoliresistens TaxID=396014 RepID=UPI0031DE1BE1